MATPITRNEFKEFCLRKLGKPVIEINVDEQQVEDRVDEALRYYRDYHFDGTFKDYLKHQVTQTDKDNGYVTVSEDVIGVTTVSRRARSNIVFANLHQLTSGLPL